MKIFMTNNVFPIGRHIAYGGERVVFYLIEELAKRHEVYVFARQGSNFTGVPIADYIPTEPMTNDRDVYFEAAENYISNTGIEPDVYQCNYFGDGWSPATKYAASAYVELTWCKWAHCHPYWRKEIVTPENIVACSRVLQEDFIQDGVPTIMIHHGVPSDLYYYKEDHDGYAVWMGKIEGGKAPHLAIELALAANMKIVIMGPPYNLGYFRERILPYLEKYPDKVFWVRGVDDEQKQCIMSGAKVFISSNDNTWKEHFGIVNIEALAMGVPIIAFNRNGQECAIFIDKIIEHGQHGYFLNYDDSNNIESVIEQGLPLLKGIDNINRKKCREQFETKFSTELMARRYEWLYEHTIKHGPYTQLETPF